VASVQKDQSHIGSAAIAADPEAREFLRTADPVMAQLIDARPDSQSR
jgi:hypothetical protein